MLSRHSLYSTNNNTAQSLIVLKTFFYLSGIPLMCKGNKLKHFYWVPMYEYEDLHSVFYCLNALFKSHFLFQQKIKSQQFIVLEQVEVIHSENSRLIVSNISTVEQQNIAWQTLNSFQALHSCLRVITMITDDKQIRGYIEKMAFPHVGNAC